MNSQTTQIIQQAIKLLRNGKLVAIPTETVYGLAADATNINAVKKIFAVKGRPLNHPLPLMVARETDLNNLAIDIPKITYKLTEKFWPGPLTIVLKKSPSISTIITGGLETIALRCPDHPLTQKILQSFPQGLAVPSANLFGEPPPISAEEVKQTLGNKIDLIVDGGECKLKSASTIVDLTCEKPKILRQGPIPQTEINNLFFSQI
ncbi:MAG: L-threonylcarbamoyladenylate synthase [Gammaproteobacteria bacterium]|jgi:L-threonylcarbamoyladenylate synthase